MLIIKLNRYTRVKFNSLDSKVNCDHTEDVGVNEDSDNLYLDISLEVFIEICKNTYSTNRLKSVK